MARKVLEIEPDKYQWYNHDTCYRVSFTPEAVRALRDKYHQIRGQPRFVDDILHLDPESGSVQMFHRRPELIKWSEKGDILILPNYEIYHGRGKVDDLVRNPRRMKDRPIGLEFTIWYVHPKQLEETVFSDPQKRDDFAQTNDSYSYIPSLAPQNRFERLKGRERIHAIEEKSGIPYLASALDLKPEHASYLREMKQFMLEHLRNVYGVNEQDKIDLFCHKAIGESTTTFHLQVRVNQALHPMELDNSLTLDEMIEGLEQGKTGEDLMIEHNNGIIHSCYDSMVDICQDLPAIRIDTIPNLFKVDSRLIPTEMPQAIAKAM